MSKTETTKFVADLTARMKGCTRYVERIGGYGYDLPPDDSRYRKPLHFEEALRQTCDEWRRSVDFMRDVLKGWGYSFDSSGGTPA
jgi:hypothetical protein